MEADVPPTHPRRPASSSLSSALKRHAVHYGPGVSGYSLPHLPHACDKSIAFDAVREHRMRFYEVDIATIGSLLVVPVLASLSRSNKMHRSEPRWFSVPRCHFSVVFVFTVGHLLQSNPTWIYGIRAWGGESVLCGNYCDLNAGSAGEAACLLINERSRWPQVGVRSRLCCESVTWSAQQRHLGHHKQDKTNTPKTSGSRTRV